MSLLLIIFLQDISDQREKRISQRGDINYNTYVEKNKLIAHGSNYSEAVSLHENCPYSEFSGAYFSAFGLNADQKNSEFGHSSRSV